MMTSSTKSRLDRRLDMQQPLLVCQTRGHSIVRTRLSFPGFVGVGDFARLVTVRS